jgi:hypothetical protein
MRRSLFCWACPRREGSVFVFTESASANAKPIPFQTPNGDAHGLPAAGRSGEAPLIGALRGNADEESAIFVDRRDTSFLGTADHVPNEEVIYCIRSVLCHH